MTEIDDELIVPVTFVARPGFLADVKPKAVIASLMAPPPPLPIRSSPRRMMPLPPPPPPSLWTRPRARRQRRAMWIVPSTRF